MAHEEGRCAWRAGGRLPPVQEHTDVRKKRAATGGCPYKAEAIRAMDPRLRGDDGSVCFPALPP